MTKKDYEKAASIAQEWARCASSDASESVVNAFVELFQGDNERFNEDRFRRACVPGANVRSRKVA